MIIGALVFHRAAPSYLTDLCIPVSATTAHCCPRSSSHGDLMIPRSRLCTLRITQLHCLWSCSLELSTVPVHPHHWSSATPDCLPSVTELSRSLLLASGTLEQSAWSCHYGTFLSCLPVPAQNPPVFLTLPPCDCTVPAQWRLVALDTIIVLAYLLTFQQPFETYLHHHPVSAAISKKTFCRVYGVNSP